MKKEDGVRRAAMNKVFNDKRLKYGTYSVVVSLVFIAILVVINLIIGQFNKSFDFTKDDMFSLSDLSLIHI